MKILDIKNSWQSCHLFWYNNLIKDIFACLYLQIRRQDPANSSGDSGSYGSAVHQSESVPSGMSTTQSSNFSSRKYSAPGGDYSAVQHGNISLELMKQTQNSKYLLSQGQDVVGVKSTSSSVNLSDTSFSSGSSHNSGALPGQRGYHSNSSRGRSFSCPF